jgi:dihydrofolate synthase / folylpolyglutamate synthase
MYVTAIRTDKLRANGPSIFEVLDKALPSVKEKTVIAVASKIIAICEGRVVPLGESTKDDLIKKESSYYIPSSRNPYNVSLSIARNTLLAAAGIDESNADGHYILWPADTQASANAIREHICKKHGITNVGVVITDSSTRPFQWGTTGIGLAHSGFAALKNYIGTKDLFGRTLEYHQNNFVSGLAAAAVVVTGEGSEQTPIALITDVPFIEFQPRNPTQEELDTLKVTLDEDIYGPILEKVDWEKGDQA